MRRGPILALLVMLAAACSNTSTNATAGTAPATTSATTVAGATTAAGAVTSAATATTSAGPTTAPPPPAPAEPNQCVGRGGEPSGAYTITSAGLERHYLLDVPNPPPSTPAPIIFNFHGSGSNGFEQSVYSVVPAKGTARGYVVVTPDGTGTPRAWNYFPGVTAGGDDVQMVRDILAAVGAKVCIDETRLFATGISAGAVMTSQLPCLLGNGRVLAIAPVAGATYLPGCDGPAPVSILSFHGTADTAVPLKGGPVFGTSSVVYPGLEAALQGWAGHDHCGRESAPAPVSAHVTQEQFAGCPNGVSVGAYIVDGGGHTWPGAIDVPRLGPVTHEIDATALILDFFDHAGR